MLSLGLSVGWKSIIWRQTEERREISLLLLYTGFKISALRSFLFEASLRRSVPHHTWSLVQNWYNQNYYELFLFPCVSASASFFCFRFWLSRITVSVFKKWLKDATGGRRCKALGASVWGLDASSSAWGAAHACAQGRHSAGRAGPARRGSRTARVWMRLAGQEHSSC